MLDDVELADTDSYYLDPDTGKMVRPVEIAISNMVTTDGFDFQYNFLDAAIEIWNVEVGDVLTNATYEDFTTIPHQLLRPMGDILAPGESEYFGYGSASFWMQNEQEPGFQVFGWMHIERSADDGVLWVLESVGSYGPESTVEEGRFHLSPGIVVGTTQVPEPGTFTLGVLALVSIIACARRRASPLAVAVLVVALHQPCVAELVFTANLPEGRHSMAPGTYTDLTKTDDGYLIEILTKEGPDTHRVIIDWVGDGESWYRVTVDQMLNNGEVQDFWPTLELNYDPWDTSDESQLRVPPFSLVTQPTQMAGFLLLQHRGTPPTPNGQLLILEFSVEEIPIPNPADFNYDGAVDFADFLRLSFYFDRYPIAGNPMHFVGDADLDLEVDFEDFPLCQHT